MDRVKTAVGICAYSTYVLPYTVHVRPRYGFGIEASLIWVFAVCEEFAVDDSHSISLYSIDSILINQKEVSTR